MNFTGTDALMLCRKSGCRQFHQMGKGNFTGTYVRNVQRLVYEESDLQYARDAFVRFDCCFFLLYISGRCIIEAGTHSYSIDTKSAFMSPAWTVSRYLKDG